MDLFGTLALILGIAAIGGIVAKLLKQPALLGYVVAGAIISYFDFASSAGAKAVVDSMGQLGVTLLLFLVGLELPISELKRMGRVALLIGVGQIVLTAVAGFAIVTALGFSMVPAMYISLALVFSSTIIIVKLLSEKRDTQTLYAKIAIGTLLVQDFIAIGILVVLSGFSQGNLSWQTGALTIVRGVILVVVALFLSTSILPKTLDWLGRSTEILFITTIAWCLGVAVLVASPLVGFGLEIGGFLAGLALANAAEHLQIVSRVRPLRDFFLTLFFVSLGANIHMGDLGSAFWIGILLSVFVLIVKPLIVMILMGMSGYSKRTAFLTSITMGQISEFSLIVVAFAVKSGQIGGQILAITALVGIITMTISTYMTMYADVLYKFLSKTLSIFERKHPIDARILDPLDKHIILFGHSRTGKALLPALVKLEKPVLVVDFNPDVVDDLKSKQLLAIFGDMSDHEIYSDINVDGAALIVSTVPDIHDNLLLLSYLSKLKTRPVIIVTAQDESEAKQLYVNKADYVLVPHAVGGEYLAHIFNHHGIDKKYITDHGKTHQERILASVSK